MFVFVLRFASQTPCRYQGYISAALVLGGVDVTGPHLYTVYPHGSTDKLPYATMLRFQQRLLIIDLL